MASEFPGNRAGKGFHSRVHALPYAGAHHSIELQHREADDHHRTDVDVSPALVSVHDSKAGGCTDRRWGRAARTTLGRLAPASSIFEHAESQHDAAQNNAYFTVFGRQEIGRIDAKTGKISI